MKRFTFTSPPPAAAAPPLVVAALVVPLALLGAVVAETVDGAVCDIDAMVAVFAAGVGLLAVDAVTAGLVAVGAAVGLGLRAESAGVVAAGGVVVDGEAPLPAGTALVAAPADGGAPGVVAAAGRAELSVFAGATTAGAAPTVSVGAAAPVAESVAVLSAGLVEQAVAIEKAATARAAA